MPESTIATPFKTQDLYVWADCPITALRYVGKSRNEVSLYATPEAAQDARNTGDDGFPHESLFQIRVEVVQP